MTPRCPKCGSDDLATTEVILGSAPITFDEHGHGAHEATRVHWDTSETTGVHCQSCHLWDLSFPEGAAYDEGFDMWHWIRTVAVHPPTTLESRT